jgi:predicted RNA-binding Zn ribbon-like protein
LPEASVFRNLHYFYTGYRHLSNPFASYSEAPLGLQITIFETTLVSMTASKQAAPGRLRLVQEFVNTIDLEGGSDQLDSAEALQAWLLQRNLLGAGVPLGEADLRRAVEVREGLRALLQANSGHDLAPSAVESLNAAGRNARLVVRFDGEGWARLEPDAAGVESALGRLLGIVVESMNDNTWARLKACARDECRWAFYDHSKNRSGRWCVMQVCGNKEKARTYRQRHGAGVEA